jgi:hypothetical protein
MLFRKLARFYRRVIVKINTIMAIAAAFITAFIVSIIFLPYRQGSVTSLIIFFVLLFLAAISSQFWIVPFGPTFYGVTWVPMIAIVIIFALLFSIPSRPIRSKKENEDASEETASLITVSIFTWILFCLLIIVIAAGVYKGSPIVAGF